MPHTVYAAAHAHPQDPQKRPPVMAVLELSDDGTALTQLQQIELPDGTAMPMFQALSTCGSTLYTIAGPLGILAYGVDPHDSGRFLEGKAPASFLTALPAPRVTIEGQPEDSAPGGAGPCHIRFDTTGDVLLCANYEAGSIASLVVEDKATGALGPPAVAAHGPAGAEAGVAGSRQDAAHPHGVFVDPSNRWLVAADLGTNCLHTYKFEPAAAGSFSSAANLVSRTVMHKGAGPRHVGFAPSGSACFVVNELDSTVTALSFDPSSGAMAPLTTLHTVPPEWVASSPPLPFDFYSSPSHAAGLAVSPDGKHVYVTNRGHDSVAGFAITGSTGGDAITPTAQGATPSGGRLPWTITFVSDTLVLVSNQYLADPEAVRGGGEGADPKRIAPVPSDPGNVTVFQRDPVSGSLTPTGAVWEAPHVMSATV